MAELTLAEAINLALREEMERDASVVILGQDVGVDGGVFRVTDGLIEDFGEERVIDTPLAESGIIGVAVGMSLNGLKPVPEMQFSGFSYLGFHQLESHAARLRYRSRGRFTVPMTVRIPYGGGIHALEHHSESREVYFAHTPGLKLVVPSGPRNARMLLRAAIRDPDPVIYFEPKAIYRAFREEVPDEDEPVEIGHAQLVRKGSDITMVAYGAMLRVTLDAAAILSEEDGVEADVIDLLTLAPLDDAPIVESVRVTGRAVVVHEAPRSYGPAAEIIARLNEKALFHLKSPIERVTGFDVIMPYFARERSYLPHADRVVHAARRALDT